MQLGNFQIVASEFRPLESIQMPLLVVVNRTNCIFYEFMANMR